MRCEFGGFRLDTCGHTLTRDNGECLPLTPKEFEILCLLVEHAGEAVGKAELLERVWPNVYVGETSVAKTVSLLRRHLGAKSIETVPKFGYRFALPVAIAPAAKPQPSVSRVEPILLPAPEPVKVLPSPTPASAPAIPFPQPQHSRRFWPVAARFASALLLAGCLLTAGWLLHRSPVTAKDKMAVVRLAVLPVTAIPETPETVALAQRLDRELMADLPSPADPQLAVIAAKRQHESQGQPAVLDGPDSAEFQKVAATLHAEYLLTARLLPGPQDTSVQVELLRADDGAVVWSAEYLEPATPDAASSASDSPETARSIAQHVRARLESSTSVAAFAGDTRFPLAREAYLRGRYDLGLKTVPGYYQALRDFQDALATDPNYARAYAGVSEAYINLGAGNVPQRPMLEKARQAALVAIRLDDHLAEAHRDLAYLLPDSAAEREYRRALQLDPNDPRAHGWYAGYLAAQGRPDAALAESKKELELQPLSLGANCNYALMLIEDGQIDRAIAHLRRLTGPYPDSELVYGYLGLAYARGRQYSQAARAFHQAMDRSTAKVNYEGGYAYTSALAGDRRQALLLLGDLLARYNRHDWVPAYGVALTYVALKDKPNALLWLRRAARDGTMSSFEMNTEPLVEAMRDQPAFAAIRQQADGP